MNGLAGKTAIVTGATRGIGRAIALSLAKHRVNIAFNYHGNVELATSLEKEIATLGVTVLGAKANVSNKEEMSHFVESAKAKFSKIDFLVNNAGLTRDKSLMFMSDEDWHQVIDTNLSGIFYTTRLLITGFLKQKSGVIVNISSTAGIIGSAGQVNYSSSKAGVIGFSKALAREVAGHNIRVNVVAPGYIGTDMLKLIPDTKMSELIKMVPMKKIGGPEDVAHAVTFLLSDLASYITGHVIPVDGGLAT